MTNKPLFRSSWVIALMLTILGATQVLADVEGVSPTSAYAAFQGSISGGSEHTCAVMSDGTVKCWGNNVSGVLGDGTANQYNSSWTLITDAGKTTPVNVVTSVGGTALTGARAVSLGTYHSCALMEAGTVKCWGMNAAGQLGDGTTTDSSIPVNVTGITDAVAVSSGDSFSCALLSSGTAKCWGANSVGQLGNGTQTSSTSPVQVSGLTGAISLTTGYDFGCAVLTSKNVVCWGQNANGQLGTANTNPFSSTPVQVVGISDVSAISAPAGGWFICAVTTGGAVKCWGSNRSGQLGNNDTTDTPNPSAVLIASSSSPLTGATSITTGYIHACALVSGGSVVCWGSNYFGQLGNNTTTDSLMAVPSNGISGAIAIGSGDMHTCVVFPSTDAKCWGQNGSGRLGDGTTTDRTSPVPVLASLGGASLVNVGATTTSTSTTSTTTTIVSTTTTPGASQPDSTTYANVNGTRVRVSVSSANGRLVIQGPDFAMRLNGQSSGSTNGLVLTSGASATFSGNGFKPGTSVTSTLRTTGTHLGKSTVGKSGSFSGALTIPPSMRAGTHSMRIDATNPSSQKVSVFTDLTVLEPDVESTSVLPETGRDAASLSLLAVSVMLAGLLMVCTRRLAKSGR